MLRGKATLPLWFEPSHDYVGPTVTEIIYRPVVLIRAGFSALGLFLGRKSKISIEETPKEFQFYIRMPNFRLLGSIMKKKYPKVADPLNMRVVFLHLCNALINLFLLKLRSCNFIHSWHSVVCENPSKFSYSMERWCIG